ncbi:hypothetical protein PKCBPO_01100 [Methylorubrum thiocyanatum]
MAYILTNLQASSTSNIPISDHDVQEIKSALNTIVVATNSEESFDGLIENYFEFEQELISITLKHMLFMGDSIENYRLMSIVSRRLMNLMSSARSYLDYTPKYLERIFGEACPEAKAFADATRAAYDGRLGYRTLEALRNYSQHRGFPVHGVWLGAGWTGGRKNGLNRYHISPRLDYKTLIQDKKFNKRVGRELEALGDNIRLKILVREYIEGLDECNKIARDYIHNRYIAATDTIDRYRSQYIKMFSSCGIDEKSIIYIVEEDKCNDLNAHIFLSPGSRLYNYLREKNNIFVKLSRRIVTTEEVDDIL